MQLQIPIFQGGLTQSRVREAVALRDRAEQDLENTQRTVAQTVRAGFLVVFGDLDAGDIATTAMIFVTGNLTVRGTLFGNCTNYMTSVLGHTRAKVLISAKEHYYCLYGGRTIERIVDVAGNTPNLDDRTDGDEAQARVIARPGAEQGGSV